MATAPCGQALFRTSPRKAVAWHPTVSDRRSRRGRKAGFAAAGTSLLGAKGEPRQKAPRWWARRSLRSFAPLQLLRADMNAAAGRGTLFALCLGRVRLKSRRAGPAANRKE